MEQTHAQLFDYELEEYVLGAVMMEYDILPQLHDFTDEVFYKPAHKLIAFAINTLSKKNQPIDIGLVAAELRSMNKLEEAGGPYAVAQLTQRVAGTQNAEYHFRKIQQLYLLRKLGSMGFEINNETYKAGADPLDIIEVSVQKMEGLTNKISKFNINTLSKLSEANIARMEAIRSGNMKSGIPSGFPNIDKKTGGWQRGELMILAARPAMGKTALAIQFALQPAIQHNIPTAFFSLEMGNTPITSRFQSIISSYSAENIIRGNVTSDDIRSIAMAMQGAKGDIIHIDDTPGLSVNQLKQRARRLKKEGTELFIVDYLQLMTCEPKGNREQEISYISRSLKSLAKELDSPIIALSQLSRDVEKRHTGTKRPQLSDLRESGAIEQDADSVFFIYRAEYYGLDTFDDQTAAAGMAEIIIAKNRNGSLGITKLGFEARNVRFHDPNEQKPGMPINIEFSNEQTDIVK